MFFMKLIITFVQIAIALAALPAVVCAQSLDDPAARAMQRIEAAVERRAAVAERVIAASKLLNESVAARKQGERERAETALKQAALSVPAPRILICGSLYLAGRVLAAHGNEEMTKVSGAGRR